MQKVFVSAVLAAAIYVVTFVSQGMTGHDVYRGYLSDVVSANQLLAADEANMQAEPWMHTVSCMMEPLRASSGYGIEMEEGTHAGRRYVFYKFDKRGDEMVVEMLKGTMRKDNLSVEVIGLRQKGMIKVHSVKEVTMKQRDENVLL